MNRHKSSQERSQRCRKRHGSGRRHKCCGGAAGVARAGQKLLRNLQHQLSEVRIADATDAAAHCGAQPQQPQARRPRADARAAALPYLPEANPPKHLILSKRSWTTTPLKTLRKERAKREGSAARRGARAQRGPRLCCDISRRKYGCEV